MTPATPGSAQVKAPPAVSFGQAFVFWLQLGFISFGGPAGQIALMHQELVERRRSTNSSCSSAICPAGPPKLIKPTFSQNGQAWRRVMGAGAVAATTGSICDWVIVGAVLAKLVGCYPWEYFWTIEI